MQRWIDMYHKFDIALDFARGWTVGMITFWIIGLLLVLFSSMCLARLCRPEDKKAEMRWRESRWKRSGVHLTLAVPVPAGGSGEEGVGDLT